MTFVVFIILIALALLGVLACLAAAVRLLRYFRWRRGMPPAEIPGMSILVPIKGPYPPLEQHLEALIALTPPFPCEILLILEKDDDPAYPLCCRARDSHPDRDIRVLLSGGAGARMGKQHNLAHGVACARHPYLACMDMDVIPILDNLIAGSRALSSDSAGAAFSLPGYQVGSQPGGRLVRFYTNYYFSLYAGSLAAAGGADFTIGSFWFTTRSALERIGGLEPFTRVVTDDAAIGAAFARSGMRNHLLSVPVCIAAEELDLLGGFRHLQKWVAMLRWQGLMSYLFILLAWHPLFWSVLALLVGLVAGLSAWLPLALGVAGLAVMARAVGVQIMSVGVLNGSPGWRDLPLVLAYEVFIVPILFAVGLFNRQLIWRGKRMRIGPKGVLLDQE